MHIANKLSLEEIRCLERYGACTLRNGQRLVNMNCDYKLIPGEVGIDGGYVRWQKERHLNKTWRGRFSLRVSKTVKRLTSWWTWFPVVEALCLAYFLIALLWITAVLVQEVF